MLVRVGVGALTSDLGENFIKVSRGSTAVLNFRYIFSDIWLRFDLIS